ncbi:MAG TPA: chloramphenicol acetyltransferase [Clostridiales bacterium]|nr:chloramphenicol acetyltransferase [Clostridiales bacterium]
MVKQLKEKNDIPDSTKITNSKLGQWCEVGPFSLLQNTTFDDYSYSGSNCIFQNVKIGKFSNIAAYVRIGATDHPMDRPSLHHFTYRSKMYEFGEDDSEFFKKRVSRTTFIGHDTWIGHGSLIKPGIHIGNGSVVGQGSVITKDIPAYAVVAGNPGRIIKYRFEPEIIEALQRIKWWNWSDQKIKDRYKDFRGNVYDFIEKFDSEGGKK